ncbi:MULTISPECIES: antitoxin Xre/MbcA/ParS toxin-binding domain-containing protein [Stutzerimonas stutzeri group]|jgi:putative toxin-antitoxin system antitoxin component (TIGR02293 family)|uniref:antitoxin Xre/MbcA/ParS toxin-binding domain-containing protein n=1 Tax=Stutzerimonas stutzeri group TaxID=136846 RepID=UPI00052DBD14|nr:MULTISPECIES: antitoxin Xre/MbcA/ParS toxin-binding domain-containing protein [Stutzerimonas stutzeri group]MBD3877623.1 DUF2384 domain-containing protein [Stutzerimonas kunmingensis]MBU0922188.1 DUF2384 domain-containing protein [Gammaproteobacteria bacterium]MCQ4320441.1 DUF2384 domain-containing protein [Stutzerimonas stutzeri]CEG51710.1 conserved hypothetical protein [Stutzerimonas xanthomarina]|tara:strand:+ start:259 stop:726 length:468 start_codon:yes stop_codon:yes gene_type:complete
MVNDSTAPAGFASAEPETLDMHDPGDSVNNLFDKLDLPKGHYYLHLAVLAGLPAPLIADLARELGRSPVQIAEWVGISACGESMSEKESEIYCRLVETLDVLLDLYDGNLEGALRWLTTTNMLLANARPVDLVVTEAGGRAVQQAIHAIEHGLPV